MKKALRKSIRPEVREKLKAHKRLSQEEYEALKRKVGGAVCPTCGGSGYLRTATQSIHEPMFGELSACPDCDAAHQFAGRNGLLPNDLNLTWDDLLEVEGQDYKPAQAAVQNALAQKHGWVYLWGPYGVAKTLLLKIACAQAMKYKGLDSIYTNTSELMDYLRGAYRTNRPDMSALHLLERFASVPLLAIDEFEKVNDTDWVSERRFRLLDKRYELATRERKGITLLASNQGPYAIDDQALRSRVLDGRFAVVEITGSDLRPVADMFDGS